MVSIRRFLMVTVSVVLVGTFAVAMLVSYDEARHEVGELFDAELAQTARLLKASFQRVGQSHGSLREEFSGTSGDQLPDVDSEAERTRFGHRYERKVLFQVRHGGEILFESEESTLRLDREPAQGYSEVRVDGHLWHLFTLVEAGYSFTAGERADIREELAEEILTSYMVPLLVGLPVIIVILLWVLKFGLSPLEELAKSIRKRGENNFTPIHLKQNREEILPVVQSLNQLFEQVQRSIELERRFTAMASHEIRTPVSVLKVNVQNALNASTEEERLHYLQELNQGIDRTSRLMEQLLTLSRLEQTELAFEEQDVELLPLLREEVAALFPLADSRKIQLWIRGDESADADQYVVVKSIPQLLTVVIRNLLENAIKYTPDGGEVTLAVESGPEGSCICFEDSGPGVPEAERELIFNRFYRLPSDNVQGSGLGLAIVKRIADILGVRLKLSSSSSLGGLRVELHLPA